MDQQTDARQRDMLEAIQALRSSEGELFEGSPPMEFADIELRWQQHANEFFAEQGMPEEFFYEPQASGQEPRLVLDTEHARVYAAWLATKGHITTAEHQWLVRDIQQHEERGHDELTA